MPDFRRPPAIIGGLDRAELHRQEQDHARQVLCAREHRVSWYVNVYQGNSSAFNGYHFTRSAYSECRCAACHRVWRTKAAYVDTLPDRPPAADPVRDARECPGSYQVWRTLTHGPACPVCDGTPNWIGAPEPQVPNTLIPAHPEMPVWLHRTDGTTWREMRAQIPGNER